jgi:hypothetical protein
VVTGIASALIMLSPLLPDEWLHDKTAGPDLRE